MLCDEAERDTELGEARREGGVDADLTEVVQGTERRCEGLFRKGDDDASDGEHGEERHLQAGVEERARAGGEHDEGGESDGVERGSVAPEQAADEVEGDHPEGPLHGMAEAGEESVGEGERNGDERRPHAREVQPAGDPEDDSGEDCEMQAGHNEQVKRAGALETDAGAVLEPCAVAGDHGSEHGCVFVVDAEECRKAEVVWVSSEIDEARAGGLLEGMQPAGKAGRVTR